MASFFPKMQKSSASFSQSIRNRLRLRKLQAQAKNFCRVLDIRVLQFMEAFFSSGASHRTMYNMKTFGQDIYKSCYRRFYLL